MTETELNERIAVITENGDAFRQIQSRKACRRNQRRARNKKNDHRLEIIHYGWYAPHIGIIDNDFEGKSLLHSGYHIKYPKNSNFQGWMKKDTNKRIRNNLALQDELHPKGGATKYISLKAFSSGTLIHRIGR